MLYGVLFFQDATTLLAQYMIADGVISKGRTARKSCTLSVLIIAHSLPGQIQEVAFSTCE